MTWAAIYGADGPILAPQGSVGAMQAATFILEGRIAVSGAASGRPVPLWSGRSGAEDALRLEWTPDGAIRMRHRSRILETAPGLVAPGEGFQIHYRTGGGHVSLTNSDRSQDAAVRFRSLSSVVHIDDFLPADDAAPRAASLMALANQDAPVGPVALYAAGTPIPTPDGEVPVEALRPGMIVETVQNGPQAVRWTGERELPMIGSMAPVRLRAPYFGLSRDVRVSRHTRILLDGPDVEYLFGVEAVFLRAGDMVNNSSVILERRDSVARFHHFTVGEHDCVRVGRCRLETLDPSAAAASIAPAAWADPEHEGIPTLDRPAAQSLLAMMGTGPIRMSC